MQPRLPLVLGPGAPRACRAHVDRRLERAARAVAVCGVAFGSVHRRGADTAIRLASAARAREGAWLRVTLSTNGTLRNALLPVLRWVDDLGLPLDGSTNARNALMRISHHPGVRHFDLVLDTLRQVQADHPAIALTLRTVITAHNVNDVAAIGDTLRSAGIDTTRLRWKLYQVNPIGVRAATVIDGGWEIPDDEVRRLVATLRHRHPRFGEIAYQAAAASRSRYLLVDPAGDAYVVGVDTNGRPARLRIGSAARQWDAFVHALRTHPSRPQDYQHGR